MEYRIVLKSEEIFSLSQRLKFKNVSYVKDEYTGRKRIRTDESGIKEKEYETPVKGVIHRFSAQCELEEYKVWFEYKWTDKSARYELEFEEGVPKEFEGRENIRGWDILKN